MKDFITMRKPKEGVLIKNKTRHIVEKSGLLYKIDVHVDTDGNSYIDSFAEIPASELVGALGDVMKHIQEKLKK